MADVWQKISEIYGHNPLEAKFASGPVGRQSLDEQQLTNPDVGIDPVVGRRRGTTPITASQARVRAEQAQTAKDVAMGFAGATNTPIRAWHGTPHVWPPAPGKPLGAPDPTKIGSGEGNATYGVAPGGYWAEARETAEGYRDRLTPNTVETIGGQPLDLTNSSHLAAYFKYMHPHDYAAKLTNLMQQRQEGLTAWNNGLTPNIQDPAKMQAMREYMARGLQDLDTYAKAKTLLLADAKLPTVDKVPSGALYEANLHVNPERLLNLDLPVEQQSKSVQDALRKYRNYLSPEEKLQNAFRPAYQMSNLVKPYTVGMAEDYAALGIPGARYLDGRSRGAGAGSYNYTIYDPKIVEILKRYGLLPPVASGAATGVSDGSQ